jgi:hypothetical protein
MKKRRENKNPGPWPMTVVDKNPFLKRKLGLSSLEGSFLSFSEIVIT